MNDTKEFDRWNEKKKSLNKEAANLLYHQGEIWWCHLGVNIGFEEDGSGDNAERPVVIIRRFSPQLCWIIPLSTSQKTNPYYIPVGIIAGKLASAIISQMRPIDTKRLINCIGMMNYKVFYHIKKSAKELL